MERLGAGVVASAVLTPMRFAPRGLIPVEVVALAGVAVASTGAFKVAGFPSAEEGFWRCGLTALLTIGS